MGIYIYCKRERDRRVEQIEREIYSLKIANNIIKILVFDSIYLLFLPK